ncbi:hypothetical protein QBC37DRAFT_389782 [Rhypophila decipiens]|uniref:F-box domain-containing protein n=1 Tax=Rhypophila decipiens TaxID=261697 RepID=A0AAN6Y4R9_9PEZI|nr:hypothetical protein QBC37DRAFT_389782 [Rhypophila decipiens]
MDPLIVAHNHNRDNLLVGKLPFESLLQIFQFIEPEDALCLRRVCRRLREAVDADYGTRGRENHQILIKEQDGYVRERFFALKTDEFDALRQRLRRDEACKGSRQMARNNSQGESKHGAVVPVTEESDPGCKGCLFRAESYDLEGWGAHPDPPRNAVPLCEHVKILWSGIDTHIATWRRHNIHMDWEACCRAFRVVCRHKEHNKRCSPEDEPTWPRARLIVGSSTQGQDPDKIYLSLEWKPHSGGRFCKDSLLPLRGDGRLSSLKVRCLLQRYRKSAGGRLLSAHHSNPLPELACFSPGTDRCKCVYYDGDDDAHSLLSRSTALPVKLDSLIRSCPQQKHQFVRGRRTVDGEGREGVSISSHMSRRSDIVLAEKAGTFQTRDCLVVSYFHDLFVCNKETWLERETRLRRSNSRNGASFEDQDPAFDFHYTRTKRFADTLHMPG